MNQGPKGGPFDALRNLGNMNEHMRKLFSADYFQNLMNQVPPGALDGPDQMDLGKILNGQMWGSTGKTQLDYPRIDIYQSRHEVIVVIEVPGLESPSDVNLNIKPESLSISGDMLPSSTNNKLDDADWHIHERFSGSFHRTVSLPVRVRPNQARAQYRNGLLDVHIPKDGRQARRKQGSPVPISFL